LVQGGGHADVVVVALPGAGAATHRLSLPFSDLRRLEQTLGFEVEGQIPFDLADVRYDYEVLSQRSGRGGVAARTEVLVGVIRRDIVSGLLEGLAALGLDPRVLTLPGLALQQLPLPALGADVILDLGHTRIGLLARENGRPSFVRGFDGGGQALTLALARARSLDWAQAEALKEQSSLVGGDPEVQAILTRALMPMVREVRQTLKQVSGLARKPIERLWLTGGTSRLEGLGELLARELGVAPQPRPDLVLPGLTPAHEDLQLGSLAVALAMRGHTGNRTSRFNLRRGDQTFQGDFSKVRERAMRLLALAAALFLLYGVRAYAEMALLGKRERQIDDAICAATKQALGKCVKDPVVARSLLAAAGGSTESTIPDQSAVALLAETASRMSVEGAKMTEMDVGIDQLQLHGTADSFETVDKVVTALKGYHCFGDVQRGRVQKSHDASEIEFNLSVRNDCAGGSQ
jgi:general secretion pathway protein L